MNGNSVEVASHAIAETGSQERQRSNRLPDFRPVFVRENFQARVAFPGPVEHSLDHRRVVGRALLEPRFGLV